jgi:type III secretion protein U
VAAKGMGALAQEMREAAQEEGVPIVRNVAVARALNLRGTINEVVPQDMFAAVAEVIVWARRMKDEEEQRRRSDAAPADAESA